MILVLGKTGPVATELQRLGDVEAYANSIRTYAPQVVINAAAYMAVYNRTPRIVGRISG